eukprot:NODE_10_length_47437_cov_0.363429.p21 type:complete len:178 gc:universal NODE_10_length_47437_cov_0.363429:5260-4727(-)
MSESQISKYDGQRNDLHEREGTGKAYYVNGDTYEGQFAHGKRNGLGTYKYFESGKEVASYEGSWVLGYKEGTGKFVYNNGGVYTGNFLKGQRDGEGTYIYPNQDYFKGYWKDNNKNGPGEYFKFESKILIDGVWGNGTVEGAVSITREDGKLTGNVQDGLLMKYSVLQIDGSTVIVE